MKIRIWNAFASNNSGSYTIVGRFGPDVALALGGRLRAALVAHAAWLDLTSADREAESPLHRFLREEGVEVSEHVGTGDGWPAYGSPPEVFETADQILVHAPYTVTLPRELGALFYRHGGRVEVELNHAHAPVLLEILTWRTEAFAEPAATERDRRQSAFRADIEDGMLDDAMKRPKDEGVRWPPVFEPTDWGGMRTTLAPIDLVLAARQVQDLAATHGLELRISVSEARVAHGDPLALLRAYTTHPGRHQVVLWKAGPDPVATIRALRDVSGCTLAEAHERLASVPIEVVVDVAAREAMAAAETLVKAGCDAQVLGPQHFAAKRP